MALKRVGHLDDTFCKVLVNGLATRFCVQPKVSRKFLPEAVEQWGKLRRLEGVGTSCTRMILFPNAWTAEMHLSSVCEPLYCQMFFETNLPLSFSR